MERDKTKEKAEERSGGIAKVMIERIWVDKEKAKRFWPMPSEPIPLSEGVDPPAHIPEIKVINVKGREEHEAVIKDADKCKELGIDQIYETIVYLNRLEGWLKVDNDKTVT